MSKGALHARSKPVAALLWAAGRSFGPRRALRAVAAAQQKTDQIANQPRWAAQLFRGLRN